MGGANQFRNSSSKRVNVIFVDNFLASTKPVQIPSLFAVVLWLLSYASSTTRRRRKRTPWTKFFYNLAKRYWFNEIFGTQITFDMFCAMKLKVRSEFPNVWGEYKNHSNPYIQGTTVPCDIRS